MSDKKIMWQKYEDVIEEQLNSPTLGLIAGTMYDRERGRFDDYDDDDLVDDNDDHHHQHHDRDDDTWPSGMC